MKDPRDRLGRALAALFGRAPRGIQLGIGPMLTACARFDHPERSFRALHVTGTNGKGSVCAMLESIARQAGLRVGMYTSPHLVRFAERIRLDGAPIDDATLQAHLEAVADGAPELTFFEATTLAAFLAFRAAKVEVAILEVGIGGRLDATNVLAREQVIATAITRVAFDHTELLGETLREIAAEKAGIARAGVPMYIGPLAADLRAEVESVATKAGAYVIGTTDPSSVAALARLLPTQSAGAAGGLGGRYQDDNRAVAALVATSLASFGVTDQAIRQGLASASWPGRFETISARGVEWLLDAAHNPDGAEALASAVASDPRDVLIFGTLADKEWPEMLDFVATTAKSRIYAPPSSGLATRPAADPSVLAARHSGIAAASVDDALERAVASGAKRVVVCGSIFLVGEARARLLDLPRDPPIAL